MLVRIEARGSIFHPVINGSRAKESAPRLVFASLTVKAASWGGIRFDFGELHLTGQRFKIYLCDLGLV